MNKTELFILVLLSIAFIGAVCVGIATETVRDDEDSAIRIEFRNGLIIYKQTVDGITCLYTDSKIIDCKE